MFKLFLQAFLRCARPRSTTCDALGRRITESVRFAGLTRTLATAIRFDAVTGLVAARTLAGTRPGSIILLHPWNGRRTTQEATGRVLDALQRDGYRFVTVSELLG